MLPSRMQVDKTFSHSYCREEKNKEYFLLCISSYIFCQKKDFPGQLNFAKFISKGTVLFTHIFARFYPDVPKKKNYSVWWYAFFLIIPGIAHKNFGQQVFLTESGRLSCHSETERLQNPCLWWLNYYCVKWESTFMFISKNET